MERVVASWESAREFSSVETIMKQHTKVPNPHLNAAARAPDDKFLHCAGSGRIHRVRLVVSRPRGIYFVLLVDRPSEQGRATVPYSSGSFFFLVRPSSCPTRDVLSFCHHRAIPTRGADEGGGLVLMTRCGRTHGTSYVTRGGGVGKVNDVEEKNQTRSTADNTRNALSTAHIAFPGCSQLCGGWREKGLSGPLPSPR